MNPQRWVPALAAGVTSFVVLSGIFVATMLVHYQAIDFPYLSFALLRIIAISVLVGTAAFALGHLLRSLTMATLFGAVAGFLGGVAFVAAAA